MDNGTVEEKLPHVVTLTLIGKKDQYLSVTHRTYCPFKVCNVEAMDSLGGNATKISGVFVGNRSQPCDEEHYHALMDYGKGILSREFSLRGSLGCDAMDVCETFISITVNVGFLEDCEWSMRLVGEALKRPGETAEEMRARAIAKYEADTRRACPNMTPEQEERFLAMLERM